jgi:hypothetical protein
MPSFSQLLDCWFQEGRPRDFQGMRLCPLIPSQDGSTWKEEHNRAAIWLQGEFVWVPSLLFHILRPAQLADQSKGEAHTGQ